MKFNFFLVFILIVFTYLNSNAQNLKYFIQTNRYNNESLINRNILNYDFIGHAYIDKSNKGIIDYNSLKSRVLTLYPSRNSSSYLVLDVENKIYYDLQSSSKVKRQNAVAKFVKMVNFVKELRPHLKVGIYGVPFRFNFDFQKNRNYLNDLRPLIKVSDFLAPDLYFSYSKSEQNNSKLINNMNENLDLFIKFAKSENKELIPFVWYRIHPYNKKFGNTDVDKDRMDILLDLIAKKQNQYSKLKGVFWWDSWVTNNSTNKRKLSNSFNRYITK